MILIAKRAVSAHDKYIELNILLLKILPLVYQNLPQREGDPLYALIRLVGARWVYPCPCFVGIHAGYCRGVLLYALFLLTTEARRSLKMQEL